MIGLAQNGGYQVQITADDMGPLLAIITWVFMTMMILAVIFRLIVKLGIRGSLKWDDYAVCAALVSFLDIFRGNHLLMNLGFCCNTMYQYLCFCTGWFRQTDIDVECWSRSQYREGEFERF
jgi:hypothetical protein